MPYDAFIVSKIVKEIQTPSFLTGVHQGKRGMVILSLKSQDVILDMNVWPHVHVSKNAEVSNDNPTPFISILRNKLKGGVLTEVKQINFDRVIEFRVEVKNLIGEVEVFEIYHEVMGAFGNLILTKNGKCISVFKNVISDKRMIVRGATYTPLPENRKDPKEIDESLFKDSSDKLYLLLVKNVKGLSKKSAIEISKRAEISFDTNVGFLNDEEKKRILKTLKEIVNETKEKGAYVLLEKGIPKDVYAFKPIGQWKYFESASHAIEYLLSGKKEHSLFESKKNEMLKRVKHLISKTESTLEKISKEISKVEGAEEFRKYGELLVSQLYALPSKAEYVDVTDWRNEKKIRIKLDPRISVSKNAQHFFEMYSKMKKKKEGAQKRLKIMEKRLGYFEQILDDVKNSSTMEELSEIENELAIGGFIKKTKKRLKRVKESKPIEIEYKGFKILIGKNNIQNDRITTKIASHEDLWFHAREVPGAHVIVISAGKKVPDDVITMAASLAAGHSRYKESPWVEVDYTKIKNVSKPKGAKPGFVLYKKFKTIKVRPQRS